MDKDKTGHDNALALVRSVAVTATATIKPEQELVDVSTTSAGDSIVLTLPNVAEAFRGVDYVVRFIAKDASKVLEVLTDASSWATLHDHLTAVGDYAVYRSNGRTWYHVDSKLT
jgi:hypothetical protein